MVNIRQRPKYPVANTRESSASRPHRGAGEGDISPLDVTSTPQGGLAGRRSAAGPYSPLDITADEEQIQYKHSLAQPTHHAAANETNTPRGSL